MHQRYAAVISLLDKREGYPAASRPPRAPRLGLTGPVCSCGGSSAFASALLSVFFSFKGRLFVETFIFQFTKYAVPLYFSFEKADGFFDVIAVNSYLQLLCFLPPPPRRPRRHRRRSRRAGLYLRRRRTPSRLFPFRAAAVLR